MQSDREETVDQSEEGQGERASDMADDKEPTLTQAEQSVLKADLLDQSRELIQMGDQVRDSLGRVDKGLRPLQAGRPLPSPIHVNHLHGLDRDSEESDHDDDEMPDSAISSGDEDYPRLRETKADRQDSLLDRQLKEELAKMDRALGSQGSLKLDTRKTDTWDLKPRVDPGVATTGILPSVRSEKTLPPRLIEGEVHTSTPMGGFESPKARQPKSVRMNVESRHGAIHPAFRKTPRAGRALEIYRSRLAEAKREEAARQDEDLETKKQCRTPVMECPIPSPGEKLYTREEVEWMMEQQAGQAEKILLAATTSTPNVTPPRSRADEEMWAQMAQSNERKRKDMNVDSFDGDSDDWLDYQTKFISAAKWNRWTDEDQFQQLIGHLKGSALALYTDHRPKDYDSLLELLGDRYVPEGSEETVKLEFWNTRLEPRGDLKAYEQKLSRLARRAFPKYNNEDCEEAVLDQFKAGLVSTEMRKHVTLGGYKTLRAAVLATSAYMRYEAGLQRTVVKPSGVAGKPRLAKSKAEAPPENTGDVVQERQQTQSLLRKLEQYMGNSPKTGAYPPKTEAPPRRTPRVESLSYAEKLAEWRKNCLCWCCGEKGHDKATCPDNTDGHYVLKPHEQAQMDRAAERRDRIKQGRNRPRDTEPKAASASAAAGLEELDLND